MTAAEFFSLYYRLPVEPGDLANPDAVVEHVTIVGDGEDFHSSDRARALLEVGYWGTLDVDTVTP